MELNLIDVSQVYLFNYWFPGGLFLTEG